MRISFFFVIALLFSMIFGKKSEESSISSFGKKILWGTLTAVGNIVVSEIKDIIVDKISGSEDED